LAAASSSYRPRRGSPAVRQRTCCKGKGARDVRVRPAELCVCRWEPGWLGRVIETGPRGAAWGNSSHSNSMCVCAAAILYSCAGRALKGRLACARAKSKGGIRTHNTRERSAGSRASEQIAARRPCACCCAEVQ
jgi:hypothetical protein